MNNELLKSIFVKCLIKSCLLNQKTFFSIYRFNIYFQIVFFKLIALFIGYCLIVRLTIIIPILLYN